MDSCVQTSQQLVIPREGRKAGRDLPLWRGTQDWQPRALCHELALRLSQDSVIGIECVMPVCSAAEEQATRRSWSCLELSATQPRAGRFPSCRPDKAA